MQKKNPRLSCFICVHPWRDETSLTARPACPRSSRGLFPRFHARARKRANARGLIQRFVAEAETAVMHRDERLAPEAPGKPALLLPDSCGLRGRSARRRRRWEGARSRCRSAFRFPRNPRNTRCRRNGKLNALPFRCGSRQSLDANRATSARPSDDTA